MIIDTIRHDTIRCDILFKSHFCKKKNNGILEFMLMKHYAPNRCEPSIEALNFGGRGGGGGGIRTDVKGEVKFL